MFFEEGYFEPEIREGFAITSMMKRAWAAELEVLSVIDNICRNNSISWFADFGTLLGAVRHQGFIPWDDDIDICLRREEYRRLLAVLPGELPKGFVIAGMYADEKRLRMAAQVHQLRIIADETLWNFNDYMRYFHGFPYQRIGVDIFPVDYLPRDVELEDIQKKILNYGFLTVQNWDMWKEKGELDIRIAELERVCNVTIPKGEDCYNYIWRLMDNVSMMFEEAEADDMAELIFWLEDDGYRMKKEWYMDTVYLPFENGLSIPAPGGYNEILTGIYGDYMKPSRTGADHTYPFYGSMEEELERQVRNVGFPGTVDEFCREMSLGNYSV